MFGALPPRWAADAMSCRRLILILGDQLDRESAALRACDKGQDRVLMIESREESTRVWSHKARTTLFLAGLSPVPWDEPAWWCHGPGRSPWPRSRLWGGPRC